jgi:zinc protease
MSRLVTSDLAFGRQGAAEADGCIPQRRTRESQIRASLASHDSCSDSPCSWLVTRHTTLVAAFLVSCLWLAAVAPLLCARQFPPAVPPPQPTVLPAPAVRVLPNGLKVVVLEQRGLPLVTLDLAIKTGSEADPPNLPGTAEFVASLLNEGTAKRTAQQIAAALDDTGATLDTGAEWDDSYATITALSGHVRLAFDVVSDIFIRPSFQHAEVERIRTQTLSALDVLRQDPEYLADTLIEELAFQGTPYSHPANGVGQSIKRISAETLQQFHARYYQPSNAVLVAVGDISPAKAFGLAQHFLGAWKNGQPIPRVESRSSQSAPERRIVAVDDPNAVQTVIRIANRAIERDSSDYPALTVANQVLGGPAENLLFSALRTRRGLVYGASSDLDCYRIAGVWEEKSATRTAETLEAVRLMLKQMKSLRGHTLGQWELENAQDYLVGHMALDLESSQDVADHLLELLIYGLPINDWNQFPQKIQRLQVKDVRAAIRSYLKPEEAVIVLVGNVSKFKEDLEKLGPLEMIPLSRVDLASETLDGEPVRTLAAR